MDFVDDDRVAPGDEVVGEPAARNAGGDDDDIPLRRLGRRLALAIDDADEQRCGEYLAGDQPDAECLASARAGDNPERFPVARPLPDQIPVLSLEERVDVGVERQFDRLARRAGGGDHDNSPVRMERVAIRLDVDGELVIAD